MGRAPLSSAHHLPRHLLMPSHWRSTFNWGHSIQSCTCHLFFFPYKKERKRNKSLIQRSCQMTEPDFSWAPQEAGEAHALSCSHGHHSLHLEPSLGAGAWLNCRRPWASSSLASSTCCYFPGQYKWHFCSMITLRCLFSDGEDTAI